MLEVRLLENLDAEMLDRLCRYGEESLGGAAPGSWMLPVIAAWGMLFVAEADGEIVGSAQVFRCRQDGDAYMDAFYVRPRFRRRGYGAALLAAVKGRLAGVGLSRLLVTLDPANAAAAALYEAAGFREVESLPSFYGRGRDRLLLAAGLGEER